MAQQRRYRAGRLNHRASRYKPFTCALPVTAKRRAVWSIINQPSR